MNRRLFTLVTCLALASALTGSSGTAAAASKKSPKLKDTKWRGQVEAVGDHFDYVGRPCPETAEACTETVARYRIQPDKKQVRKALDNAAGNDIRLTGHLARSTDPQYEKALVVKKVKVLGPVTPPLLSGVEGSVSVESDCPGRFDSPDCQRLAEAFDKLFLRLLRADGSVAATGYSAENGTFRLPAAGGSYTLEAVVDSNLANCAPVDVEIPEGSFTHADVRCEAANFQERSQTS